MEWLSTAETILQNKPLTRQYHAGFSLSLSDVSGDNRRKCSQARAIQLSQGLRETHDSAYDPNALQAHQDDRWVQGNLISRR
jgi:hypothetical protein